MAAAALPGGIAIAGGELRPEPTRAQIDAAVPIIFNTPPVRTVRAENFRVICSGLRLPEGPIAMPDGGVLVTEVEGRTLSRCTMDGRVEVVAELGGGPNGAAIGPDGACYVSNNGKFRWQSLPSGLKLPADLGDYDGGYIQRVDLATGMVETLYDSVDGRPLSSPNDLVFDGEGGFWFTDWGKPRARSIDKGGLYYAKADGSMIREVVHPLSHANGVGLSPDGSRIYVSESHSGRLLAGDVRGPGEVGADEALTLIGVPPLQLLAAPGGNTGLDSLKVEADGSICIGTIGKGGITRVTPDGAIVEHTPLPDFMTTNMSFGGPDMRTCFVTLSARGQLAAVDWPRPGLRPHYLR